MQLTSFLLYYETQRFNEPKIKVPWDMMPVSVGSYRTFETAVCLHIYGLSSEPPKFELLRTEYGGN